MATVLSISMYLSLALFVIGCFRRVRQYTSAPVHLRWELYPVPHEEPARARYGGSFMEQSEWWTRPNSRNYPGELRAMFVEIFLFKSLWTNNRGLWWRSLIFHGGMYCIGAAVLLKAFAAVVGSAMVADVARTCGFAGLTLVVIGSLALLWRRASSIDLKNSTHAADFAHLLLLGATAGFLIAGVKAENVAGRGQILIPIATFRPVADMPLELIIGMLLSFLLVAYIPFSPMAHFIGKYFAFHHVRWDDTPNRGGARESVLVGNLQMRPTWAAAHVGADGRSWAEIAAHDPTAGNAK